MKFITVLFLTVLGGSVSAKGETLGVADFFNKATYENMEAHCKKFYTDDIIFVDPLGEVSGIDNIIKYYKNLYENVVSIRFETRGLYEKSDEKVFVWQMHLVHKKVGDGKPIVLDGVSVLKYRNDKVVFHQDYFDLGAMIYEKVPVLGSLIRWIKKRAHGGS